MSYIFTGFLWVVLHKSKMEIEGNLSRNMEHVEQSYAHLGLLWSNFDENHERANSNRHRD